MVVKDLYVAAGRPWFFARALLGTIDDATFGSQPYREPVAFDTHLMHAWKAQLANDPARALDCYDQCGKDPNQVNRLINDWLDQSRAVLRQEDPAPDPGLYPHPGRH